MKSRRSKQAADKQRRRTRRHSQDRTAAPFTSLAEELAFIDRFLDKALQSPPSKKLMKEFLLIIMNTKHSVKTRQMRTIMRDKISIIKAMEPSLSPLVNRARAHLAKLE